MLKSINIKNFKGINNQFDENLDTYTDKSLQINNLAQVNYLIGKNGSGKTSFLECIKILKSFNSDNIEIILDKKSRQFYLKNLDSPELSKYFQFRPSKENGQHKNSHESPKSKLKTDSNDKLIKACTEIKFSNLPLVSNQKTSTPNRSQIRNPVSSLLSDGMDLFFYGSGDKVKFSGKLNNGTSLETILSMIIDLYIAPKHNTADTAKLGDYIKIGYNVIECSGKRLDDVKSYTKDPLKYKKLVDILQKFMQDLILVDGSTLTFDGVSIDKRDLSSGQLWVYNLFESILSYKNNNPDKDVDILIIDEPETSSHPEWQKSIPKILQGLQKFLKCIIIVATHSPFIISQALELEGQKVYFIENGTCSNPEGVSKKSIDTYYNILDGVGAAPADFLFANSVVWVEGPSDVIYLQKWLQMYALERDKPVLKQGVDYEFNMYSGALLKFIYASDDQDRRKEAKNLVNLFTVHPRSFIVMDSDVATGSGELGVMDEMQQEMIASLAIDQYWLDPNTTTIEYYIPESPKYWKSNVQTLPYFEIRNGVKKIRRSIKKTAFAFNCVKIWDENPRIRLSEFENDLIDRVELLYNKISKWSLAR